MPNFRQTNPSVHLLNSKVGTSSWPWNIQGEGILDLQPPWPSPWVYNLHFSNTHSHPFPLTEERIKGLWTSIIEPPFVGEKNGI